MNLFEVLIESLDSLGANKMRSGLTILGIVIGVGAVIAMLSVEQGAQSSITGTISDVGTNLLLVFSGSDQIKLRNVRPLTLHNAEAIGDPFASPHVVEVSAMVQADQISVAAGGEQTSTTLGGVTPEYFQVRNYKVAEGDKSTQEHVLGCASVVLLGVDVADKLFYRHEGLVGETVRIDGQPFRVIGVMEKKVA